MNNKDKPLFNDNEEAHIRYTLDRSLDNLDEFVQCQVRANEVYLQAWR